MDSLIKELPQKAQNDINIMARKDMERLERYIEPLTPKEKEEYLKQSYLELFKMSKSMNWVIQRKERMNR